MIGLHTGVGKIGGKVGGSGGLARRPNGVFALHGCDDATCCEELPKCIAYTCGQTNYILVAAAATTTGATDAECCELAPLCSMLSGLSRRRGYSSCARPSTALTIKDARSADVSDR